MARPVTLLVVFFLAFNLFAGMLMATGTADMLGINAQVGEDQAVDDLEDESGQVDTGGQTGGTLFNMYSTLANFGSNIFGFVFPGLRMLERVGAPTWITGAFLGPLFSLLIAIDIASFLRGWSL